MDALIVGLGLLQGFQAALPNSNNYLPINKQHHGGQLEKRADTMHPDEGEEGRQENTPHPQIIITKRICFLFNFLDLPIMLNEFHKLVIWPHSTGHSK